MMERFLTTAQTYHWGYLLPELCLAGLALGLLGVKVIAPSRDLRGIAFVTCGVQSLLLLLWVGGIDKASTMAEPLFGGMLRPSFWGYLMRGFLLLSSLLMHTMSERYLTRQNLPKTEFYILSLIVTGALMLLVQSHHFIMFFVALETVTLGFCLLISYDRKSTFSLVAGFKYLVLGALSAAILLFGIVLLYGVGTSPNLVASSPDVMHFDVLGDFIAVHPDNYLVAIGAAFVIVGIAFKIGVVPFHIWIPDVYQGAPTPVTAFLAVASKAAGFFALFVLVKGPLHELEFLLVPLLSVMAILTIVLGNTGALMQRNLKRLMGLSGVAHAGFLLLGVIAVFKVPWAASALFFYLWTYLFASYAVFTIMVYRGGAKDEIHTLDAYRGLGKQSPFLAGVLTLALGSLAGIPPLGGFMAKFLIFVATFLAGHYPLAAVAALGIALGIYYYFYWIRKAVFKTDRPLTPIEGSLPWGLVLLLSALTTATVVLGFYQGGLIFGL